MKDFINNSNETYDTMYEADMFSTLFVEMILPRLQKLYPDIGHATIPEASNYINLLYTNDGIGKNILDHFQSKDSPFVLPMLNRSSKLDNYGHWVSCILHIHDNKLYIVSLNPCGGAMESTNREMINFLEANKEKLGVESIIIATEEHNNPGYVKQYHQYNDHSCGPYALYNIELAFGLVPYREDIGQAYNLLRAAQLQRDTKGKESVIDTPELLKAARLDEEFGKSIRDRYKKFAEEYSAPTAWVKDELIPSMRIKRNEYLNSLPGKEHPSVIDGITGAAQKPDLNSSNPSPNIDEKLIPGNTSDINQHLSSLPGEAQKPASNSSTPNTEPTKQPTITKTREQLVEQLVSGITNIRSYDKETLVKILKSSNVELPESGDKIAPKFLEKRAINDFSSFSAFCKSIYELFTRIYYGEKLIYKNADEQKFSVNQKIIDNLLTSIKTDPEKSGRSL